MVYATPQEALQSIWGYPVFRPMQEEIIRSILQGNDTLAILPTGGGKSICYQVPAMCREGICLVISPLIALMKDQVDQLREKRVPAYAVHSGMTDREIDIILDNCVLGQARLLYVSPERLKTELFLERVRKMKINLLAVDEAHCISQWGYDFRPPYLEIAEFRKNIPGISVLALTASATPRVREDIIHYLSFSESSKTFVQSFRRSNLAYVTRKVEDKEKKLVQLLKKVKGTVIVYTRSRKRTKSVASLLLQNGLSADYYHAGLTARERSRKQDRWMNDRIRIMVATNAFGMGINKAEVRLVIHLDLPANVESYYQEAGRAGRDEKKAIAVILYQKKDKQDLRDKTSQSVVDPPLLKKIYQALANYYKIAAGSNSLASYDFDLDSFTGTYGLDRLSAWNALKKLGDLGLIQLNEGFYHPSRIIFNGTYEEIYKFQVEKARFEPLIKTLLRLYGGELYSSFVTISEKKIASSLKVQSTGVEKDLEVLEKSGILTYDKQKDRPQVVFLTPRLDASRLPIDSRMLESRKEHELAQMESMIRYIENDVLCRSLYLQHYFGEKSDEPCGICDVCLEKKKQNPGSAELIALRNKILDLVSGTPMDINLLLEHFPPQRKEAVLRMVRLMLDSSQIRYDQLNTLHVESKV